MPKIKVIIIPDKTTPFNKEGEGMKETKTFVAFLFMLLEIAPQKSFAETTIVHTIKEKLEALSQVTDTRLELDENEHFFIKASLEKLQAAERINGSGWYYLISPILHAEDKQ